jgi:hypothetical protein
MSQIVVIVNLVTILEVIKEGFCIPRTHISRAARFFASQIVEFCHHPLVSKLSIGHHQLHSVIFLFHAIFFEAYTIHCARETVGCADFLEIKVGIDILASISASL